jgi:hypothetical protein
MDGKRTTLLICKVQEKKPDEQERIKEGNMRGRPGNPSSIHRFDYVITAKYMVDDAAFRRLEAHDHTEIAVLEQWLEDNGISGEIIVQRARGGLGRKSKFESTAQWKAKRNAGNATVVRLRVD